MVQQAKVAIRTLIRMVRTNLEPFYVQDDLEISHFIAKVVCLHSSFCLESFRATLFKSKTK